MSIYRHLYNPPKRLDTNSFVVCLEFPALWQSEPVPFSVCRSDHVLICGQLQSESPLLQPGFQYPPSAAPDESTAGLNEVKYIPTELTQPVF